MDDTATRYRLRITASDGGTPRRQAETTLTFNIVRNLHAPVFIKPSYKLTGVLETQSLGETLVVVNATDADTKVNIE